MALGRLALAAASGALSHALGPRLDPYSGCNFFVEVEGLVVGGFRKVNGLGGTLRTEDHAEGGFNAAARTFVGGVQWNRLVLSHGLTELDGLWSWFEATARGVIRRRTVSIMVLDEERMPFAVWNALDALPVAWSGPELDATGSGLIATERVELAHRGLQKPVWSQLFAGGLAAARATGRRG